MNARFGAKSLNLMSANITTYAVCEIIQKYTPTTISHYMVVFATYMYTADIHKLFMHTLYMQQCSMPVYKISLNVCYM